ncbi:hypothetical protein Tco_1116367 [Tanacetum coccineum]
MIIFTPPWKYRGEGDRCPYDLSKPLPLQGPHGHTTIPVDLLFNNNLEYLKTGNTEKKYASSLTKPKAARYELEGLEEMIPNLWSSSKVGHAVTSSHTVYSHMKILSIIRISVDKQYGYGYLKEIVVRRANQKEYVFKEADFPKLHLNDSEDMYLIYAQNKLHHLKGDEQVDLVTALCLFIRRIVLIKRVEDVQLRVKSFQTKINIIRPQVRCANLDDDEIYKFSDGTLKPVRDILNSRLHYFDLGYNNRDMPKRSWTKKDQKRTASMLKKIDQTLLKR